MFLIEMLIGEFGSSNMPLTSYLIALLSTIIAYIYGMVSQWSVRSIFIMLEVSILSIISNISGISMFYIMSMAIILIIITIKIKLKITIKNKVAPNIIAIFLILFVFITGTFIVVDTAKDGVNQTINKINSN